MSNWYCLVYGNSSSILFFLDQSKYIHYFPCGLFSQWLTAWPCSSSKVMVLWSQSFSLSVYIGICLAFPCHGSMIILFLRNSVILRIDLTNSASAWDTGSCSSFWQHDDKILVCPWIMYSLTSTSSTVFRCSPAASRTELWTALSLISWPSRFSKYNEAMVGNMSRTTW